MKTIDIICSSKRLFILLILFPFSLCMNAQELSKPYVETIYKARSKGISIEQLDQLYESAVHSDTSKAVFKTRERMDELTKAYQKFLQNFGSYLHKQQFYWEKTTRCWNRIYFNKDGSVDYYLFDFKTDISEAKTERFKELFKAYASSHKIGITAPVNFAQCSPVLYTDK